MKDDKLYLIHISECIARIEQYTPVGKDKFFEDHMAQDAVLRNLHTLTESIQRISSKTKLKYTEVDWRAISGFRNVVVHDYLGIDIEQIWDIVSQDLPELKTRINSILEVETIQDIQKTESQE